MYSFTSKRNLNETAVLFSSYTIGKIEEKGYTVSDAARAYQVRYVKANELELLDEEGNVLQTSVLDSDDLVLNVKLTEEEPVTTNIKFYSTAGGSIASKERQRILWSTAMWQQELRLQCRKYHRLPVTNLRAGEKAAQAERPLILVLL